MIGDDIKKELNNEQYSYYLELLDLLDRYDRGPKESYDDIVKKLCELLPQYEKEILDSTSRVYELRNNDDYLTEDEISSLLD